MEAIKRDDIVAFKHDHSELGELKAGSVATVLKVDDGRVWVAFWVGSGTKRSFAPLDDIDWEMTENFRKSSGMALATGGSM